VVEHDDRRLQGKVAIVTGAGGGIGRAVAQRFAEAEATVICVDIDGAGLAETADLITKAGRGGVAAIIHDVTDAEGMIERALGLANRIDVLHANAAVQFMGDLEDTSPDDWDRMYAVNQRAVAASIRQLAPHMRENGGGSIIITASLLALTGDPDLAMYGATKGALSALCKSVASALGPHQVRCNTICPGDVDTRMVQEFFDFQPDPAAARREIEQHYPLRRIATPRDIANAALFLASDESAYITGTDLIVDGGLTGRIY
jgi:NAD(P)-dependent dehydrogenase (short-subunit alcohol dehydrogenase family)